jgi:putative flavoprotein involved in K+ transport
MPEPHDLAGAHYPAVVVGGGQAGLSASYCLGQRGVEHVVLEAHQVGHEWRTRRWESFCLVTPNWQCRAAARDGCAGHPLAAHRDGAV